jgi:outer membrane protein
MSIVAISLAGACFAQESLSLQKCVELAWENNLQIKQSELTLEASESTLKSTKASTLPNFNGFATHNYNWGQRIDPFTNQFATTRVQSNSFGVSSSMDLFNGFQNYQNINAQEAALSMNSFDLEVQKNNIALSVSAGYLSVLLADELIDAAEQQVTISKQQLSRVEKLVLAGSTNLGSQYDLEAQLARDNSTLVQRQNDYQLAMLRLKQLLMLPADESISLEKPTVLEVEMELRLENSTTVYGFAESNMPEIKRAECSLMRWESQMKSAQSSYYPSLSLSGSLGTGYSGLRSTTKVTQVGTEPFGTTSSGDVVYIPTYETQATRVPFGTQLGDNFNQFIGLSLNVPIFNRGSVNNSVKQAKISRSKAELQLEQERLDLRQRIESARADAVAARELYKSSELALKSAEKAFEFANARFEAGALNVTDYNTAKNNVQIANAQQSRSKYDFVFKVKVLDFYMGKPLSF